MTTTMRERDAERRALDIEIEVRDDGEGDLWDELGSGPYGMFPVARFEYGGREYLLPTVLWGDSDGLTVQAWEVRPGSTGSAGRSRRLKVRPGKGRALTFGMGGRRGEEPWHEISREEMDQRMSYTPRV